MEYLVGFFVGTSLMVFSYRFIIKNLLIKKPILHISLSQSQVFNTLRVFGLVPNNNISINIKTQSTEYEKSQTVRVIMTEGQAYWIRDNVFYTADINDDYSIDNDSTRIVDTISMDRVQLEKIISIVDKLTEGSDDDTSSPRDKKF